MTTVKEAIRLLSGAKKVGVCWGGCVTDIDPTNELEMDAYGSYVVTRISEGVEKSTYELQISMYPVKASAAGEL